MASRVGNYLLFETLGEGAFGKVKLGVHEETGEQVAVKIMDKSDIKAQEMTMNVRREIAIMKALKHRNIVNLRQVLTSQSKLYIVMDLVTGGELFTKILKEGKLEENTARHYFQQLVDGIEYCHRRGVCHRDLKPENLLIDETTGELKITDFGLSAMKGASTTEELLHTQCGSPNYCAPEIIARHKQGYNGAKVDAWSCGIILFALLAGFLPFYDENTKVLYRMIQRDDVKFPKKFPPEAKDLVLRLLHKEPEKRYTLNDVKRHPWFLVDYAGGDLDSRAGGSAASPPSRTKKRRHGRKASIDQGPKSRDLQPRKKSEKSDRSERSDPEGSASQPLPPVPPPVIDAPLGHSRPPVPPPVSGANPAMSPIPPPQHSPAPVPSAHNSRPPTVPIPPPASPKSHNRASGSAPVYTAPGYGNPRRKNSRDRAHRRSRDTFPALQEEITAAASREQKIEENSGAPAYPFPAPPPFPPAPPVARAVPPKTVDIISSPSYEAANIPGEDSQTATSARSDKSENIQTPGQSIDSGDGFKSGGTSDSLPPVPPAMSPRDKKWSVPNATRHQPRFQTGVKPVSTPVSLAEGDSSWMKNPPKRGTFTTTIEKMQGLNVADVPEEPKSESIVGRLRHKWEPDLPRRGPSEAPGVVRDNGGEISDSQNANIPPRFGDRGEVRMKTAYPTVPNMHGSADASVQSAETNQNDAVSTAGVTNNAEAGTSEPTGMEQDDEHRNEVEAGPDDSAMNGEDDLDDDTSQATLKQRLTAALARYRRIFKLGTKIGITASPSFTSNKGTNIGDGSGDDEGKKASERSDFFARAKGVTGAWGIILSQELEDESDSEDDRSPVTEEELNAFSRLLDFWDNRRASATVSQGAEVILDDEEVSPLSEDDITKIQSLLQKLEPKPEDDVKEVDDVASGDVRDVESERLSDGDVQALGMDANAGNSVLTIEDDVPLEGDTNGDMGVSENEIPLAPIPNTPPSIVNQASTVPSIDLSSQMPVPPPVIPAFDNRSNGPPPMTEPMERRKPVSIDTPSVVSDTIDNGASSSDIQKSIGSGGLADEKLRAPVVVKGLASAAPPTYEAPKVVQEIEESDLGLRSAPGVMDIPPPPSDGIQANSNVRFGGLQPAVRAKTQDGSDPGTDKDPIISGKRKSSANNSEDHEGRRTTNRTSGRVASGTSEGSGRYGRHIRTPSSGEDHAKRGLFAFNMLGRRKSAMTTFDTELMPDDCLLEVGKVLVAMGCDVMMKRGENKMKCVARLKNDTLRVSITCTREKKVSHVQFKKGKRDRSQVDAREFFEFFEVVRTRFVERTGSGERS